MRSTVFLELASADAAVACARLLRERGFELEAYTPYAVLELEQLTAQRRSRIPWVGLVAGAFGCALAFSIIWYCNAYDYPLDVGGRPLNSIPADIPIMFETAVLFAALATFGSLMFVLGLPRLAHPIFDLNGFERVSVDRFWIGIDAGTNETTLDDILVEIPARVVRVSEKAS